MPQDFLKTLGDHLSQVDLSSEHLKNSRELDEEIKSDTSSFDEKPSKVKQRSGSPRSFLVRGSAKGGSMY